MEDRNPSIDDVLKLAKSKNSRIDTDIIKKAYLYAKAKHQKQKRKSGEPYIIHPLNVAYIVAGMGLDSSTISAALLHDVVEDTDAVYEDIEKLFSKEIAEIVEGVTKIAEAFSSAEERQAENYKKLFTAMEKDIRVILLKIADRLHNVKTLKYLPREKQKYIAKETIDIYAPIANKLGMFKIKSELEKYAFKYLKPREYRYIYIKMNEFNKRYNSSFNKIKSDIVKICEKNKIVAKTFIERKPIYSIYKKIIENNERIEEIKDLISIRVVVGNKTKCYMTMGILMEQYQFIPSTFKDVFFASYPGRRRDGAPCELRAMGSAGHGVDGGAEGVVAGADSMDGHAGRLSPACPPARQARRGQPRLAPSSLCSRLIELMQ